MYSKNVWQSYSNKELKDVMAFADNYKKFLSISKTERCFVKNAVEEATAIVSKAATIKATNSAVRGDLTYIIFDLDKKVDDDTIKTLNDKFVKARLI